MNLSDTVQALEAKGVTIALDIGVHTECNLDSNCPLAVQLRRLVTDAGITLEQLLEGYQEVTASDPVDYELPEFSSTIQISIAGRTIELDFDEVISVQLKDIVARKLAEIENLKYSVRGTGIALYSAYLGEIQKQKDSQVLPQINFTVSSLLKANCLVTGSGKEYTFLFPAEYNPQYLIKRGTRYKLSSGDITEIKRKVWFKLTVTQAGKFLRADVLNGEGRKFQHYHGDDRYDCWGDVTLPAKWDGKLSSLSELVHTLAMSLVTVNLDSILLGQPLGMPHTDRLLERSTELGREGEAIEEVTVEATRPTGWGRRGLVQPRDESPDEVRIRRFGRVDYSMDGICTECGTMAGAHFDFGMTCPRDH